MLKVLRTYRPIALFLAFALVTTAFAPLSAVCGMDLAESMPVSDMPAALPCDEMGGMESDHTMPMEQVSPRDSEDSSDVMFALSCCFAQGPTAPQTKRTAPLAAQVAETVSDTVASPSHDVYRQVAADESPPPPTVSLHLLLGHFLV